MRAPGVKRDPLARRVAENARAMIADQADAEFPAPMEKLQARVLGHGHFVEKFLRLRVTNHRAAGGNDPALEAKRLLKLGDIQMMAARGDDHLHARRTKALQGAHVFRADLPVGTEQRVVHVEDGETKGKRGIHGGWSMQATSRMPVSIFCGLLHGEHKLVGQRRGGPKGQRAHDDRRHRRASGAAA